MASNKRDIRAYPFDHDSCTCCGKAKAKRISKSPAPLCLIAGADYMALCMTCAKTISSSLDAAIERIEESYTLTTRELKRREQYSRIAANIEG
jgi:hypothetical protein